MLTLSSPAVITLPAGDGVRDTTTLTITSDIATEVSLTVAPVNSLLPSESLPTVQISGGSLSASVQIAVDGLSAGDYVIEATPTVGTTAHANLTVGSGEPSDVVETLSASTIFTWTGSSVRNTVATVSATDETGLEVPFTGTVVATVGGATATAPVTSFAGESTATLIPVSALALGTGTVVATVWGPSATHYASAPAPLTVSATAVTSVSLAASHATVYPSHDGYIDSVSFTVTPETTGAAAFAATGHVTITRNGKTVKSWTLTSSTVPVLTWDGRVNGKIVPGTYSVKVTLKGPEGLTQTATKTVRVSGGRLVTKTKSVTYKSGKVFTAFGYHDAGAIAGKCSHGTKFKDDLYCQSAGIYTARGLWAYGHITIPADMLTAAAKFGGASARASLHAYTLKYSSAHWSTDLTNTVPAQDLSEAQFAHERNLSEGTNYGYTHPLTASSTTLYFTAILYYDALLASDTITMRYTYKAMQY